MIIKSLLFLLIISSSNVCAQVAEIPFEIKKGLILLQAQINNSSEVFTFILDTGATSDLLDLSTALELGIKADSHQNITGASGTKRFAAALNHQITLQKEIRYYNVNLVLTDLTALRRKLEKDFDGIIGYNFLKNYISKIDYENQKISLYDKIEDIDLSTYTAIPFDFRNGLFIPQFDISITLKNGENLNGRILFDSGAAITLLINSPFSQQHNLSKLNENKLVSKSENLYGESISEAIGIKSMRIRNFELGEMPVSLSSDQSGISSYENYLGILGSKIIKKFNVILDYSAMTLYLSPNKDFEKPITFFE